jgi:hypothetical protein
MKINYHLIQQLIKLILAIILVYLVEYPMG